MANDEILEVKKVFKDGFEYLAKCPHCGRIVGMEGELSEIKGEQYHDGGLFGCDGWFEVSYSVKRVDSLEEIESE